MNFSVLSFQYVGDEPGMSFGSGSDCPQASQTCCYSMCFSISFNFRIFGRLEAGLCPNPLLNISCFFSMKDKSQILIVNVMYERTISVFSSVNSFSGIRICLCFIPYSSGIASRVEFFSGKRRYCSG